MKRFDAFIVLRRVGPDVEVHTVGASGIALDEIIATIVALLVDAFPGEPVEKMVAHGGHPNAPTCVRVGDVLPGDIKPILETDFETILEGK